MNKTSMPSRQWWFPVSKHNSDLLTQLIGEHDGCIGLFDHAGKLAQSLGHQAGLHAHRRVAHITFDLSARHQRSHRVDHHERISTAPERTGFGDLQSLLAGIRFGNSAGFRHPHRSAPRRMDQERVPCQCKRRYRQRCASATMCWQMVVFPRIRSENLVIRPRGTLQRQAMSTIKNRLDDFDVHVLRFTSRMIVPSP